MALSTLETDHPSETGYPLDNSRQTNNTMNNPPDFIQLSIRQFWQILKMDYQSQTDNASPVWKRPIVTLLLIIPFYFIKDLDPILNITESQC